MPNSPVITFDDSNSMRPLKLDDATELLLVINANRSSLLEWLPIFNNVVTLADMITFLYPLVDKPTQPAYIFNHNGSVCGMIWVTVYDAEDNKAEIGYWLSSDAEGSGLVSRGLLYLRDNLLLKQGVNRLVVRCAVNNHRSRRVPERLGFTLEGIEREGEKYDNLKYNDVYVFSFLRSDYKKNNNV